MLYRQDRPSSETFDFRGRDIRGSKSFSIFLPSPDTERAGAIFPLLVISLGLLHTTLPLLLVKPNATNKHTKEPEPDDRRQLVDLTLTMCRVGVHRQFVKSAGRQQARCWGDLT
jgi:hypothetical protein